jgi:ABC-type Fe3+ transport system permease subunit
MDEKKQPVEFDSVGEHSRQTFWQIYLPLALVGIAALACIFFLLKSSQVGTADLRVWADISVIFMILPAFFLILLWLILNLVGSFAVQKNLLLRMKN